MYDLILASESPRRKRILSDAGFTFDTFPVKVSEIPGKNLNVDNKIIAISREKSQAAWTRLLPMKSKPFILLTADTEVVTNGELLGKPLDLRHGVEMLGRLSGRIHLVKTALCLVESIQGKEVVHV